MELGWGEGRRSDFGRSVAEFIELPHYRSVVTDFEKRGTRSVRISWFGFQNRFVQSTLIQHKRSK